MRKISGFLAANSPLCSPAGQLLCLCTAWYSGFTVYELFVESSCMLWLKARLVQFAGGENQNKELKDAKHSVELQYA